MKPFYDKGKFRTDLPEPQSSSPPFLPRKNGFGVEIRNGRDLKKRNSTMFISSGKWTEMQDDGLIDQQITPGVIGELIDVLDIVPFSDADERKSPESVLNSSELIKGNSIDFEGETNKDGRITVFNVRSRGYVSNEEIPFKTRGIKVESVTITGRCSGVKSDSFLDGGSSTLGITREGFYGEKKVEKDPFSDRILLSDFGTLRDTGDFSTEEIYGTNGFSIYSSEFGIESIAFLGLLK